MAADRPQRAEGGTAVSSGPRGAAGSRGPKGAQWSAVGREEHSGQQRAEGTQQEPEGRGGTAAWDPWGQWGQMPPEFDVCPHLPPQKFTQDILKKITYFILTALGTNKH